MLPKITQADQSCRGKLETYRGQHSRAQRCLLIVTNISYCVRKYQFHRLYIVKITTKLRNGEKGKLWQTLIVVVYLDSILRMRVKPWVNGNTGEVCDRSKCWFWLLVALSQKQLDGLRSRVQRALKSILVLVLIRISSHWNYCFPFKIIDTAPWFVKNS